MKKSISLLLCMILIWGLSESFGQNSFVSTINIGTTTSDDKVNAITKDGSGNIYITGKVNGNWVVKKYNASMVQQFTVDIASGEGVDIEFYSNTIYVIGRDLSAGEYECIYTLNSTTGATISSRCYDVNTTSHMTGLTVNAGGITIAGTITQYILDDNLGDLLDVQQNGSVNFPIGSPVSVNSSIFLIKLNLSLGHVWWRVIAGNNSSSNSACYGISTILNAGVYYSYITGYFGHKANATGAITFPGTSVLTSAGGTDIYIARFTNNSSLPSFTFSRKAGGTKLQNFPQQQFTIQDYGSDVSAVFTGGVETCYLTGSAIESATFGSITLSCGTSGNSFGYVASYSNAGVANWASIMGGCITSPNAESNEGLAVTSDGSGVYVTGRTLYGNTNSGDYGIYVGRHLATTGALSWHNIAVNQSSGTYRGGKAIAISGSCNLFVGGEFYGGVKFGNQVLSSSTGEGFLTKLPKLITWSGITSGSNCTPSSVTLTSTGGSYLWSNGATTNAITVNPTSQTTYTVTVTDKAVCSQQYSQTISPAWPANAGPDKIGLGNCCPCLTIGVAPLPGSPSYLWTTPINGLCNGGSPSPTNPQINVDVVGTYTLSVSYPGCFASTDQMVVTLAQCCRVGAESSNTTDFENLTLVPNPSSGYFQLEFPWVSLETAKITITDVTGKIVKQLETTEKKVEITMENSKNGFYFIDISRGSQKWKSKIVIQH